MQAQHCDDGLCQVRGHDISSPDTMPYHAPKHATWEYVDISDPDTPQPQQSQHARGLSRCAPTSPPPSGYAYVPPFTVQPQPRLTHEASDEDDANDGFTEAVLFPLPPTSQHSYCTFPAPSATTPTTNPHDPCYFETLDFSDYQHNQHQHPRPHPSLALLPPPARSVAADNEKDSAEDDAYRPRGGRGWAYDNGGGRDVLVTRSLLSSSFGVDGRVGVARSGLGIREAGDEEEKRVWRAASRRVAVVVVAWMVVVGVLVVLQWVVEGGGGKFVDDAGAMGDADGVHGDWGPCTEARPRFCRLVVGAGEQ